MKFASKTNFTLMTTLIVPLKANGEIVRHLFDYNRSPLALQTNAACGSLTISRDAYRCNPALLRSTLKNMGIIELTTLAQESTFRALWKFATEPLTGNDVARLFSEYSFSTFSGFARFATTSPWFALEYVPFSLQEHILFRTQVCPTSKSLACKNRLFHSAPVFCPEISASRN